MAPIELGVAVFRRHVGVIRKYYEGGLPNGGYMQRIFVSSQHATRRRGKAGSGYCQLRTLLRRCIVHRELWFQPQPMLSQ